MEDGVTGSSAQGIDTALERPGFGTKIAVHCVLRYLVSKEQLTRLLEVE